VNGYEPTLKQRLDLYAILEDRSENCRMKTLIKRIIIYSTLGKQQ